MFLLAIWKKRCIFHEQHPLPTVPSIFLKLKLRMDNSTMFSECFQCAVYSFVTCADRGAIITPRGKRFRSDLQAAGQAEGRILYKPHLNFQLASPGGHSKAKKQKTLPLNSQSVNNFKICLKVIDCHRVKKIHKFNLYIHLTF